MKVKFVIFLVIVAICATVGLGSWGVTETSEARYAEIGREIISTHDFVHPNLLGIHHYHKPPVTYWLTALGYKIFGVNAFGARFFLVVALIVQLILVYKITLHLFKNEKIAFYSSVLYFSFPIVLISIRNLTTDAYLNTFALSCMFFWISYLNTKKTYNIYLYFLFLGIGFLTKGPVILLPVFAFVILFRWFTKQKFKFTIHNILGFLGFLAISGSWFGLIIHDKPQLWSYFTQHQLADRMLNATSFHRNKPFWYYLWSAPLVGFPLAILIALNFKKVYKNIIEVETKRIVKSLGLAVIVLLVLFSCFSSKLILYILPVYPLLAILGGYLFKQMNTTMLKYFIKIYLLLFAVLIVGGIWVILNEKLNINTWLFFCWEIIAIGGCYSIIWYKKRTEKKQLLYMSMLFSCCLLLAYTLFAAENPSVINSSRDLTSFINKHDLKKRKILVYNYLLPSLSFALEKDITTLNDGNYTTQRNIAFQSNLDYKQNYYDLSENGETERLENTLAQMPCVLILSKKHSLNKKYKQFFNYFKNHEEVDKWIVYY
ncbi:ArnT family glycosyltransferase [Zhouia sp. PK063]|uniref:ArnT family glycosyltransferase n=1 Tax=Zhouia sp. PK063 TaxID=3373602 RepID=UPI0037B51376